MCGRGFYLSVLRWGAGPSVGLWMKPWEQGVHVGDDEQEGYWCRAPLVDDEQGCWYNPDDYAVEARARTRPGPP